MTEWKPPADARIVIVCAACRAPDGFIAAGPRHFDDTMHKQVEAYVKSTGTTFNAAGEWEQGFIDQWGRFYGRERAMLIVKANNQPFDRDRNGGSDTVLYSEGLY